MKCGHRVLAIVAVVAAIVCAGCEKSEADSLAAAKSFIAKDDRKSAVIELKNVLQKNARSAEARYLLGLQHLLDGNAPAAVIELNRARRLRYPRVLVLPKLATALYVAGESGKVIESYSSVKLDDPKATADVLTTVADAFIAQGNFDEARAAVERSLAEFPGSERTLLVKARLQTQAGDDQTALHTLDGLLAAKPDSHLAWALKGDILLGGDDGQAAAMSAYRKALSINDRQVYSHSALISLHLARGEVNLAHQQFATLRKLAPKSSQTAFLAGQLALVAGDDTRARSLFQKVLRRLPNNPRVLQAAGQAELRLNSPEQAEAMLAKAVSLVPSNADSRRLLAQARLRLGRSDAALETLEPLLEQPNASASVVALAAEANLVRGNAEVASALFERVAKLNPVDSRTRTLVALSRLSKGDIDAVINELQAISDSDNAVEADMALVSAHIRRNQLDKALKVIETLERKRPNQALPPHLRGQVLLRKGDVAGARKSFEQALSKDQRYFPAVVKLAELDLKDKKIADAKQRFIQLIKLDPKNSPALMGLAELAARANANPNEIGKFIGLAVKANPTNPRLWLTQIDFLLLVRKDRDALAAVRSALTALPDNVELLVRRGRIQLRLGEIRQARTSFSKALSLEPQSAVAHIGVAQARSAIGDLEGAAVNVEAALDIAPRLLPAAKMAVKIALQREQPLNALAMARRVQAERGNEAIGYVLEGEVEMHRTRWDAAVKVLRAAVNKTSPGVAPQRLHQALRQAGKTADAQTFAEQWLKNHPDDTRFLFSMGDVAHRAGDMSLSVKRYRQVLALQPHHIFALNNLAMVLLSDNKPGAVVLAKRAVRNAPNQPILMDTLAQAYASENQTDKAIEVQKEALEINPDASLLRLTLAKLYIQAGNKKLAKLQLKKLATLGREFKQRSEVRRLMRSLSAE